MSASIRAFQMRLPPGARPVGLGLALVCALCPLAAAADNVAGNLIMFNNDGNWSWYMDERALVDTVNGTLLIGSQASSNFSGYPGGAIDVTTYDMATGTRSRVQLADRDEDDHNAPALLIMPDGRYLAAYASHYDQFTRFRTTINPHDGNDLSDWNAETTFSWDSQVAGDAGNFDNTYDNLYYLSAEDRIYNFTRAYQKSPNMLLSSDNGATWSWGTPDPIPGGFDDNDSGQLTQGYNVGYVNGYYKYASNGVDRIDFIATEEHPRDFNNSMYHAYIQGGKMYKTDGTVIDEDIFDDTYIPAVTNRSGSGTPEDPYVYTPVASLIQEADPLGSGYNRLWTVDLELGGDGNPVAMYTSRWDNDGTPNTGGDPNPIDHRIHYARWDGTQWQTYEIAKMGNRLYNNEQDYTGNGALVPGDANTLYVSTQYDPRDPSGATETSFREIYKGVTADGGASWDWTAITSGSTSHNLRPIVPKWDEDHTALIWFKGTYNSAQNTDTAIVGIIEQNDTQTGLVHYVDATTGNTTRDNGSAIGATGPSNAAGANDGLWHWRTGFGNGGSVLTADESSNENLSTLKTTVSVDEGGSYDVFAFFWADPTADWRFRAGFDANNLLQLRDNAAQQAEAEHFDSSVTLTGDLVAGGANPDVFLYRTYIGRTNVLDGGMIDVFIDDSSASGTSGANRTWYDGIGYALVSAIAPILIGDYNGDFVVNTADYTVWRDHLGQEFDLPNRDPMNDGLISHDDYTSWKTNYGNFLPQEGGGSLATVPEPSTTLLMMMAAALMSAGRRRCHRSLTEAGAA